MSRPLGGEGPRIVTIDETDGTLYVLFRPGLPPIAHPWPSTLLELAPDARWEGAVSLVHHDPPLTEQRDAYTIFCEEDR